MKQKQFLSWNRKASHFITINAGMEIRMKPIYLDETRADKERAEDLVSRMTLEEKVSQLKYDAPAIKRLGIPNYNWWNEALHGVARAGAATVFPQSIGLAATFDDDLLLLIGDITATEGRAKYHEAVRSEDRGLYKGITYWSPNINIFRDPRWGRGHETYGEDPYLTGRIGCAYINGLQGKEKRMKAAACVKHFAAHSGPEAGRHSFNSIVSKKELAETYYPAFIECIQKAHVEGVMGGYNRLNGEACCGSELLITELIRDTWGFDGYFVSDCGAIKDFHKNHEITSTVEESAALALNRGCDLNCGAVYQYLMDAYEMDMITEEVIDQSVTRVMNTRLRLGMFDEHCDFEDIPYEVNDCKEHHEQSLRAAEKSMVLLKNDGILPLDQKKVKNIAVIGPNADSDEILRGNYNGTATEKYTLLEGIRSVVGADARIFYSEGSHLYRNNVESLAEADDRIKEAVSIAKRCDVVFLCLGLNATLEGEEGDANNSYAGADKVDLNFPGSQMHLFDAVCATGTPVVLMLATGSAMAITQAEEKCAAILQVWYPGQMGGIAAANILFGHITPSGKLPVTFYRTTEELPDFADYSMRNRTYRFMENEALYPFGYGLSYADITYHNLKVDERNKAEDHVTLTADVCNHSVFPCEEIVQVYVKIEGSKLAIPNGSLVDFKRVRLEAQDTVSVIFTLPVSVFSVIDEEGYKVYEGKKAHVYLGGSQPDKRSIVLTGKEPLHEEVVLGEFNDR